MNTQGIASNSEGQKRVGHSRHTWHHASRLFSTLMRTQYSIIIASSIRQLCPLAWQAYI